MPDAVAIVLLASPSHPPAPAQSQSLLDEGREEGDGHLSVFRLEPQSEVKTQGKRGRGLKPKSEGPAAVKQGYPSWMLETLLSRCRH